MRTRHHPIALTLLLLAPALLITSASQQLARRAAPPIARQLLTVAEATRALLPAPRTAPTPLPLLPEARAIAALNGQPHSVPPSLPAAAPAAPIDATAAAPSAAPPAPSPARGVLVSKRRVLAAARRGIRPSGYAVAASDRRPAGVALIGVAALGVGLRDGDVLTHVNGMAVSSPNQVVALAAGALRSGASTIGGQVWRGQQRLLLTVQLPSITLPKQRSKTNTHVYQ